VSLKISESSPNITLKKGRETRKGPVVDREHLQHSLIITGVYSHMYSPSWQVYTLQSHPIHQTFFAKCSHLPSHDPIGFRVPFGQRILPSPVSKKSNPNGKPRRTRDDMYTDIDTTLVCVIKKHGMSASRGMVLRLKGLHAWYYL